ncbi:MAG: hypothetical protein HKN50_13330 [Gammaproteobacteria bacterium]|nr:hypothetical protein [Gammaproteobacteria bacterium]
MSAVISPDNYYFFDCADRNANNGAVEVNTADRFIKPHYLTFFLKLSLTSRFSLHISSILLWWFGRDNSRAFFFAYMDVGTSREQDAEATLYDQASTFMSVCFAEGSPYS